MAICNPDLNIGGEELTQGGEMVLGHPVMRRQGRGPVGTEGGQVRVKSSYDGGQGIGLSTITKEGDGVKEAVPITPCGEWASGRSMSNLIQDEGRAEAMGWHVTIMSGALSQAKGYRSGWQGSKKCIRVGLQEGSVGAHMCTESGYIVMSNGNHGISDHTLFMGGRCAECRMGPSSPGQGGLRRGFGLAG